MIENKAATRFCLLCNHQLKGRTDKKFCNDACRSQYHHMHKAELHPSIQKINKILLHNRSVLSLFLEGQDMVKVSRDKMLMAGFSFDYSTHHFTNRKGCTYQFVYDLGYLDLQNHLLIVREKNAQREYLSQT
jgi:hypothetical protein